MLENLVDATENCRHSLMCRHVCPVGNITRLETLSPHGWAQLIALERRGLSSWNEDAVDALYQCADCGSCRTHCVSSQPLPDAIVAARAEVVLKDVAPSAVYEIGRLLRTWENPYAQKQPDPADDPAEAALFVGDDTRFLRPTLLEAALKLLHFVGIKPALIGKGRNSGLLASSLGLPGIARDLARSTLAELEATGAKRLFVLSPGHFYSFGQLYDERLGIPMPPSVELLEVIPYLAEQLEAGVLRLNPTEDTTPYAYVDPTHSVRVTGRYEAPRKMLCAVLQEPAIELFWRKERAYPCGNVALEFTASRIADELTKARLADAARAGAQGVISEGPGSLTHLDRYASAYGLRVRGLYELLADQLAP